MTDETPKAEDAAAEAKAKRAQLLAAAARRERRTLRRWAIAAWTATGVYAAWVLGPQGLIDWRLAAHAAIGAFLAGPLLGDLGWAGLKRLADAHAAKQKFKYKMIRRLRIYRAAAFMTVAMLGYLLAKATMLVMFDHLPAQLSLG